VITLLKALRGHLRGLDLSRLSIRGAYLQGVEMQDASLSGALLQECVFTGTLDAIIAVVTSLTGQFWAAASKRGEVRVWREGGQILHLAWQAHTDQTYGLAVSPDDGSLLASGGHEGTVRLWDPKLGTALQELSHPGTVFSLAWSPDGTRLVGGGDDGHVYVWDAADGTLLQRLAGHHGVVNSVAWSPVGDHPIFGGELLCLAIIELISALEMSLIGDKEAYYAACRCNFDENTLHLLSLRSFFFVVSRRW
jgi:WD40 repeat protein